MAAHTDSVEHRLLELAVDLEGAPDDELLLRLKVAVIELAARTEDDPQEVLDGIERAARRETFTVAALAATALQQLAQEWELAEEDG
jgi:hypothetical protein